MAYVLPLKVLVFLIVCGVCLASNPDLPSDLEKEWADFKIKYNKHYPNKTEEEFRKAVFAKNLKKVREHNAKYNPKDPNAPHFKMGINKFGKFWFKLEVLKLINVLNLIIIDRLSLLTLLS